MQYSWIRTIYFSYTSIFIIFIFIIYFIIWLGRSINNCALQYKLQWSGISRKFVWRRKIAIRNKYRQIHRPVKTGYTIYNMFVVIYNEIQIFYNPLQEKLFNFFKQLTLNWIDSKNIRLIYLVHKWPINKKILMLTSYLKMLLFFFQLRIN